MRVLTVMMAASTVLIASAGCKKEADDRTAANGVTAKLEPALVAAPVSAQTPPLPFSYGWIAPCRVPATHCILKAGKETCFDLEVTVAAAMYGYSVRLENPAFHGVAASPGVDGAFARAMGLIGQPTARVSPNGEYLGADGTAEAVEEVLRRLDKGGRAPSTPDGQLGQVAERAADAAFERLWTTWIGAWTDLDLKPGESRDTSGADPLAAKTLYRHLGAVQGRRDLVLLSLEITEGGPALRKALEQSGLAERVRRQGELTDVVETGKRFSRYTVALDPATGRPHRARFDSESTVQGWKEAEVSDTVFHWGAEKGCGH